MVWPRPTGTSFQQDVVLERLASALDLTMGLEMM